MEDSKNYSGAEDYDKILIRLPSGTVSTVFVPRVFTIADGLHLMNFLTLYLTDKNGEVLLHPPTVAALPSQSTGMRCPVCCAKAGESHASGCSEAPVPTIAVQDAMMALDADRMRRMVLRGPDRRQQQTELVPNMRRGVDRRKA